MTNDELEKIPDVTPLKTSSSKPTMINSLKAARWTQERTQERKIYLFILFIYLFIYLFTDLFKERACPQLAMANLGGPCLNKQITKKYTTKIK